MRRRHRAPSGIGRLAVMLLAVLTCVLPSALPTGAMPTDAALSSHHVMAHGDCPGLASGHYQATHVQTGTTQSPSSAHHGHQSHSDQACCCSAVCAGIIPTADFARLLTVPFARGVAPQASAILEGLPPSSLSEPPRTSYQG